MSYITQKLRKRIVYLFKRSRKHLKRDLQNKCIQSFSINQKILSIIIYFSKLNDIWDEFVTNQQDRLDTPRCSSRDKQVPKYVDYYVVPDSEGEINSAKILSHWIRITEVVGLINSRRTHQERA